MAAPATRPVHIAPLEADVRYGDDGTVYLQSPVALPAYPPRITDHLERWAADAPGRTFLAQRRPATTPGGEAGDWYHLTYADALTRVRRIAQGLLARQLSTDRPVLILSGNGIDHALLALAAMYVGVPYAPIAPAYSLQARDFGALTQIVERMNPGLVFAADGAAFARAIAAAVPAGTEIVVSGPSSPSPEASAQVPFTLFSALEQTVTADVDAARDRVGPDTVAKVLFTSGSTGRPKGVINTQRMLCSNQEMIRSVLAFLGDEPPVLCCWLPWNHTAGGNHNFGLVLRNGGTYYIDEGRPTPQAFGTTLRNLREVAASAHFTVPRTYELLLPHLRTDAVLRGTFFRRLQIYFYAAAGLGQRFWDELRDVAIDACGEALVMVTGFGATETAPFALTTGKAGAGAGMVGLPCPGMQMKLAPVGSKLEARVKGPNVTPGYWGDEALTRDAFDDEGYYRLGDAMTFVDPSDPSRGLIFDGRLAEDFKLSTGTWVSVGPLRSRILAQAAGLVQDVVIAGHERDYPAALVFPNLGACRALAGLPADTPAAAVVADPRVVSAFTTVFDALARLGTGSSTAVGRALLLDEPPSLDARELTDKGSLNQKAVLQRRTADVDALYAIPPSARVIVCRVSDRGAAETARPSPETTP
jgi:feruloyl-CoA synthase